MKATYYTRWINVHERTCEPVQVCYSDELPDGDCFAVYIGDNKWSDIQNNQDLYKIVNGKVSRKNWFTIIKLTIVKRVTNLIK